MKSRNATRTWVVEYSDHDAGSAGGHMIRRTRKDAERTARLLKGCGYRKTSVRQFTR
jgi:hypothetical protein